MECVGHVFEVGVIDGDYQTSSGMSLSGKLCGRNLTVLGVLQSQVAPSRFPSTSPTMITRSRRARVEIMWILFEMGR